MNGELRNKVTDANDSLEKDESTLLREEQELFTIIAEVRY